jgi:hypothetical protein
MEASQEMQFYSSPSRYRRVRSVKRKKLGELLYRDLANCRTVLRKPPEESADRKEDDHGTRVRLPY